jgi:single-strand DNA-binding protein
MTDQNSNGSRPRSANGFIDMVVVGNAGSDPEMRYTPSGTAVTNFSLAINVRVPRDGEWVVETIWVRVTCWGRMAETANQYIKKGDRVLVSSDRLTFDPDTGGPVIFTRSSGQAGASFEITARDIRFLGGNASGNNHQPEPVAAEEAIDFS